MTGPRYLGLDIGGSGIKGGLVDVASGRLIGQSHSVPTPSPAGLHATSDAMSSVISAFPGAEGIGIGYPGVVKQGHALSAANLTPEWVGVDLPALFSPVCGGCPVVLNDADAAALAEMAFGAGQSENHPRGGLVLIVTFGTGIGSALCYRGRLIPNMELGHIEIDGADAELAAAASARVRDQLAWSEWGARVNRYLRTLEKLLSFDLCIIGGGVSENFSLFRPYLDLRAMIQPAQLGNHAGLIGAALAASVEQECSL